MVTSVNITVIVTPITLTTGVTDVTDEFLDPDHDNQNVMSSKLG